MIKEQQDDNKIGIIEGTLRGAAGIGVGYGIFAEHNANYASIKKNFLGLNISQSVKRAFTKIFQFSTEHFDQIEFQKSLSTPMYIQNMMNYDRFKPLEEEILRKKATISDTFLRIDRIVNDIQFSAQEEKIDPARIAELLGEYEQYKGKYYEQAMTLAESMGKEQFKGRDAAVAQGNIAGLRSDQAEMLNQQLKVIRERTKMMEESLHSTKNNIFGVKNRSRTKMVGISEDKMVDIITQKTKNIEDALLSATNSVKSLATFRAVPLADELVHKAPTKFWTIGAGLGNLERDVTTSQLIGREGTHSLSKVIGGMFEWKNGETTKDTPNSLRILSKIEERNKRREFVGYTRDVIRNLQRSGQFTKIELGITTDFQDSIIIKGIRKDGKEISMSFAVPKASYYGTMQVQRGGKEFFQPFTRQRNISLEMMKKASIITSDINQIDENIAHRVMDANDSIFNELMLPSKTAVSDKVWSNPDRYKFGMLKEDSERLFHAYDAMEKVSKNKMGRGNILHLSVSGEQIGWEMRDWKGRVVDAKQFAIGANAGSKIPSHLIGKKLNGHNVVQQIGEGELEKVVDALATTVQRSDGKPLLIASASKNAYELQRIGSILRAVDKKSPGTNHVITSLMETFKKEHALDINDLPRFIAEKSGLKNTQMRLMLGKLVGDNPRMLAILNHMRKQSFLPEFDRAGQQMVEHMGKSPLVRAAQIADFVELLFISQKKYLKQMGSEKAKVGAGILPRRLETSFPLDFSSNLINMATSASSIEGGVVDLRPPMLTRYLPGQRPELEWRGVSAAMIGNPNDPAIRREFLREVKRLEANGLPVDGAQIMARLVTEVPANAIVSIDPTRGHMKDMYSLGQSLRRNFIDGHDRIVVNKGSREKYAPHIKLNSSVHHGSVIGQYGNNIEQFKPHSERQRGTVTDIIDNRNGTETIVIARHNRINENTIFVLGNTQAATASGKPVEELYPSVGPRWNAGYFTAASEKNNPGELMMLSIGQMYTHAGTGSLAETKSLTLTRIINKHFGVSSDDVREQAFRVVKDHATGDYRPDVMTREHWEKFFHTADMGDIVSIAEQYKQATATMGDAYTGSRLITDELGRNMRTSGIRRADNAYLSSLGVFMAYPGFIEGNIRQYSRETSESAVTSRANDVRKFLESAKSPDDIKRAWAMMTSKNVMELDDILKESPAYLTSVVERMPNGTMEWQPKLLAMAGFNPTTIRSSELHSGQGVFRDMPYSLSTINHMKSLRGSKKLLEIMQRGISDSNPHMMFRLNPFPLMSSRRTPDGMRAVALSDAAGVIQKEIGAWMAAPGMAPNWRIQNPVYVINGTPMTREMAVGKYNMSGILFDEAVRDGTAQLHPHPEELFSRIKSAIDVEQMNNMSPFSIEFGRDNRLAVEVPGSKSMAEINRLVVARAAANDYYPIQVVDPQGNRHTRVIETPEMASLRDVLHLANAGVYQNFRQPNLGGPAVQNYINTMTDHVFKWNLKSNQRAANVPLVRLQQAMLFTDFPQLSGGVTTKDQAMRVLAGVYGTEGVSKKMALNRRGMLPKGEGGFFFGVSDREIEKKIGEMMRGMTDSDIKAYANNYLGNISIGRYNGPRPAHLALKMLSEHGTVEERKWASNGLGILHNMANGKRGDAAAEAHFMDLIKTGFAPVVGMLDKEPTVEAGKFVSGEWYRVNARNDMSAKGRRAMSMSGSSIAFMPVSLLISSSRMDADGDTGRFMMSAGKVNAILDIMKNNTSFSELNPVAEIVGTEKGTTMLYNHHTNEWITRPFGVTEAKGGLDKAHSIRSQIWTKQAAGKVTFYGDNLGHYLGHMMTGRGGGLAADLGQGSRELIMNQASEWIGAIIEGGALKSKRVDMSGIDVVSELFDSLNTEAGVRKFYNENLGTKDPMLSKLFVNIPELASQFGSDSVNAFDVMLHAAKGGRALSNLSPEEILIGKATLRGSQTYQGKLVDAIKNVLPDMQTDFTPWRQEGVLKALKKNIMGEQSHNEWWKNSKGLGWAAAAGAVFLASNIFRPDDNTFLGHRPGRGGEELDWSFTRPEYEMAGLLDVPYKNPWDKKRAYVTMDNPSFQEKLGKLSRREQEDLNLFQAAMGTEKTRSMSTFDHRRSDLAGYRNLLERYGHT
jgi:hypothetical protein